MQSALASTGYKNVLVTGHSLGAAVASLDAVMLKMALPSDVAINSVVFGLPRVGNAQWASLVDSLVRFMASRLSRFLALLLIIIIVHSSRASRTSQIRRTPCRPSRHSSSRSCIRRARLI